MAKTAIEVNRSVLENAIAQAEANGPLANLGELWKAAAVLYNRCDVPKEIGHSVVMLRATAWKIETKTKAGKRGRAAGVAMTEEHKAKLLAGRKGKKGGRAAKFAADPEIVQGHKELKKEVPARFESLVERTIGGSMKAAVALKCLDCSGYETAEVRKCVCQSCPLFAFRPYRAKDGSEGADEIPELEEAA